MNVREQKGGAPFQSESQNIKLSECTPLSLQFRVHPVMNVREQKGGAYKNQFSKLLLKQLDL